MIIESAELSIRGVISSVEPSVFCSEPAESMTTVCKTPNAGSLCKIASLESMSHATYSIVANPPSVRARTRCAYFRSATTLPGFHSIPHALGRFAKSLAPPPAPNPPGPLACASDSQNGSRKSNMRPPPTAYASIARRRGSLSPLGCAITNTSNFAGNFSAFAATTSTSKSVRSCAKICHGGVICCERGSKLESIGILVISATRALA